jgi:N6-adenosine-specific RNA methylase IME4
LTRRRDEERGRSDAANYHCAWHARGSDPPRPNEMPMTTRSAPPGTMATDIPGAAARAWSSAFLAYVRPGERTLALPADLPIEDWVALGADLHCIEDQHQFWIGDWWRFGNRRYGESAALAESIGIPLKTLKNVARVAARFEVSRRRDDVTWSHHEVVAGLPSDHADALLERAATQGLPVVKLRHEVHRIRNAQKLGVITATAADLRAQDKFCVILADPPWQVPGPPDRTPENHYETMPLEEIFKFDVPSAEDCVLFLWAPNCLTADATKVMEYWGFDYKTNLVWVKTTGKPGLGFYARNRHELLHVGVRGDLPAPLSEARFDSVIMAPRGEHSAKPVEVYDRIDAMYPGLPKVELFARGLEREGWTGWGDQARRATL